MYRIDKKVVKIIRKQNPKLSSGHYGQEDIWEVFHNKYPRISLEEYLASLKSLNDEGFISFSSKTTSAFTLTSKGYNYYEYRRQSIRKYIAEKWIDFFALAISAISLILSVIALMKP